MYHFCVYIWAINNEQRTMKTQHTPEPWMVEGSNVWQENGLDVDQSSIATTHGPNAEAIAQRIVACVNACRGINPEAVPDLLKAASIALAEIEMKNAHFGMRTSTATEALRAALSKATGTK